MLLQFADAPLAQVMVARTALEPAMAARNVTDAQLAAATDLLSQAEHSVADHDAFTKIYREFWAAIAAATGNAVTTMLWPALRALVPNERYRQRLTRHMRSLLVAMERRDVDAGNS